jgi:hypothetical protein
VLSRDWRDSILRLLRTEYFRHNCPHETLWRVRAIC